MTSNRSEIDEITATQLITINIVYSPSNNGLSMPVMADQYSYLVKDPALKIYIPDVTAEDYLCLYLYSAIDLSTG